MGPPVARAKKAAKAKNRKDDGVRVMAALLQLILFYRLCSIPSNKHVGAREFCDMRNCQVELRDGINLSLSAAAFSDDSCQPRWCGAEVLKRRCRLESKDMQQYDVCFESTLHLV